MLIKPAPIGNPGTSDCTATPPGGARAAGPRVGEDRRLRSGVTAPGPGRSGVDALLHISCSS